MIAYSRSATRTGVRRTVRVAREFSRAMVPARSHQAVTPMPQAAPLSTDIKPVVLIILDGVGCAPPSADNAVANANKPNWDALWSRYAHTSIDASELRVGLPSGQMGNSEVGHLNIGAGRVVYQ